MEMFDRDSASGDDDEREYDYSTGDVEIQLDELVEDVRAELPIQYARHIDRRRRCKCKRYLTDLNAHPSQASGRGTYCRLQPLDGQELVDSLCGEKDTWVEINRMVKNMKGIEDENRDLRVRLEWQGDQLLHMEETTKEALDQAANANATLKASLIRVRDAVQNFSNTPQPFSYGAMRAMVFETNKAMEAMNDLSINTDNENTSGGEEEPWCAGTDWEETDDERAEDLPDLVTDYEEDYEEENESGNEGDVQGGNDNLAENTNHSDEPTHVPGEDAGASRTDVKTNPPPQSDKKIFNGVLLPPRAVSTATSQSTTTTTTTTTGSRSANDSTVIDSHGATRHTGLLPTVHIKRGTTVVSFADDPEPDPPAPGASAPGSSPPDPSAGAISGNAKKPPRGYQFPGLLEPTLPIYHQTGGTLCGGSPNLEEAKYLAKVISVSPNKQDNAEQWIEKWSQLLLTLKVNGGSCTLYTILTIWVKQTPTLYRYYSDLLEKQCHFTSFIHFISEFTKLTYPNLKSISLSRLQSFKQKDHQNVREYRLELLELLRLADRQASDYIYEFIGGLKAERHRKAIENREWNDGEMTIDSITQYLSKIDDLVRVNRAMQRPATVSSTNARGDQRSSSVPASARGSPRGRAPARGGRGSAKGGGTGRGRGAVRGAERGGGRGRAKAHSVATTTVDATFRGGFRGRTRSRGGGGRGRGRGSASRPFVRGGGASRGGGQNTSTNQPRKMTFPERLAVVRVRRKTLNLMGGNKTICEACFSTNHHWTDATFGNCTANCLFCNKNINQIKHGHLECFQRPSDYNGQRMAILNRWPIMNSA